MALALKKPEGTETTGCKHCGCMLNTEFTQVTRPISTWNRKLNFCVAKDSAQGACKFKGQIRVVLVYTVCGRTEVCRVQEYRGLQVTITCMDAELQIIDYRSLQITNLHSCRIANYIVKKFADYYNLHGCRVAN